MLFPQLSGKREGQKGKAAHGTTTAVVKKNKKNAAFTYTYIHTTYERSRNAPTLRFSHVVELGAGGFRGFSDPCRFLLAVLLRRLLDRKQHHHSEDRLRHHRQRPVLSAVHVCEPDKDWSLRHVVPISLILSCQKLTCTLDYRIFLQKTKIIVCSPRVSDIGYRLQVALRPP